MSKSIGLLQGFILYWQIRKPHYEWNNCRTFGIKQVSSSCCISNAHSRWSKKTSFAVTFPPARPPAPYDHRLPPLCRVGCRVDFPDSMKGIHPTEFLYKGNHFWCQTMIFFLKLPSSCRVGLRPERTIFRSGGQDAHGVLASFWIGTAFSNTLY